MLKDTSVTAGIRTHILLPTPELESGKLDRSATTLLWRCMRFLEWCCSEGSPPKKEFAGREKTDDVWIGGGGSGGSGEYDCAHQTALPVYNTRNKKCLPESPLLLVVLFFRGRGSQFRNINWSNVINRFVNN